MDGFFTVVPQEVARMMAERGASGNDWAVLMALAHCTDGTEIGVNKGYVMSARDVSEYLGGSVSPDSVRHSLSRMVAKGILVRSRRVRRGDAFLTVYALPEGVCQIRHGGCDKSVIGGMTDSSQTSTVTNKLPNDITTESSKARRRGLGPVVPYPRSVEEILGYMRENGPFPEVVDDETLAERFLEYNSDHGWTMHGRPIRDWRLALQGFCEKIDISVFS